MPPRRNTNTVSLGKRQAKENEAPCRPSPSSSPMLPSCYEFIISFSNPESADRLRTAPVFSTHSGANYSVPDFSGTSVASMSVVASGQSTTNVLEALPSLSTGHHSVEAQTLPAELSTGEPTPFSQGISPPIYAPLSVLQMPADDVPVICFGMPDGTTTVYTFTKFIDMESRFISVYASLLPPPSQRQPRLGSFDYLPSALQAMPLGLNDLRSWLSPAAWKEGGSKLTYIGMAEATYLVCPQITEELLNNRHESGDIVVPRSDYARGSDFVRMETSVLGCTLCKYVERSRRMTKHVKTEEHRQNLANALRISVDALPAPHMFKCMYLYFGCNVEMESSSAMLSHEGTCFYQMPVVPLTVLETATMAHGFSLLPTEISPTCLSDITAEMDAFMTIMGLARQPEDYDMECAGQTSSAAPSSSDYYSDPSAGLIGPPSMTFSEPGLQTEWESMAELLRDLQHSAPESSTLF